MTIAQNLLLIEDDSYDVEMTLREFEGQGFTGDITVCRSGAEALAFLQSLQTNRPTSVLPIAILIGWKLPQMDGFEVLRRIKTAARLRRIPSFMLLSSHLHVDYVLKQAIQPDGYLIKPVVFQEFVRQFGPAATRHYHGPQLTWGHIDD